MEKAPHHQKEPSREKGIPVPESDTVPLIQQDFPTIVVWRNVILFGYLHTAAFLGIFLLFTGNVKWQSVAWVLLHFFVTTIGITAGAHRLWSHRAYKAKLPLRILLAFFQTITGQNSIFEWARDHRVHHKYSETHADPHNVKRGFFFAHIGWLLCKKHPAVIEKGKLIDLTDLELDPVVRFQKKNYLLLVFLCRVVLPTAVPIYFWDESYLSAIFFVTKFTYCFSLHRAWLINSAGHSWGYRPYDKSINPAENVLIAMLTGGEGWHNYHHTFPWDYKTAELGNYRYNITTGFLDFFAWVGWAYELKVVSKALVQARVQRTGDGCQGEPEHAPLGPWGWDDKEILTEHVAATEIRKQI